MEIFPISVHGVEYYRDRAGVVLVDLRDEEEYKKGHIKTAVNIPFEQLEKKKEQLYSYDIVIFYCERGNVSLLAAREYGESNQKVYTLVGGYLGYTGNFSIDGY